MDRLIICLVFLCSFLSFSQDYKFIPKEFKKVENKDFFKIASQDTLMLVKAFLENGTEYNTTIKDSLKSNKLLEFYVPNYFVKEKQLYIVYKKQTLEEKKISNLNLKNNFKANYKNFKNQNETILEKLEFTDINEKKYTLDSLKEKVIVINFWFIGCKPCVKEIPDLNKIQEKFKDKDVVFLAVTFDTKKKLQEFVKKKPFNFTLIPSGLNIINQFYVNTYPTTLVIDKERKIHLIDDVLVLDLMNKIEKMIHKYLK